MSYYDPKPSAWLGWLPLWRETQCWTGTRLTLSTSTSLAPRREGWFDLGSVGRRTRMVEEVVDQGDEWVFRFAYGGVQAGEIVMPRAELAKEGSKITVPPAVPDRLREAGVSESAR